MKKRIVVAIGGASGSIYAQTILDTLAKKQEVSVDIVMSKNARFNWELELGKESYMDYNFKLWENDDFMAPFASGSAKYDGMIIIPCSMGILGRVASGISNDLISRAADVFLKERRKVVFVAREMPLSLIHIRNMETITLAGGIICPAMPSFYSGNNSIDAAIRTVTNRALDLLDVEVDYKRWGND